MKGGGPEIDDPNLFGLAIFINSLHQANNRAESIVLLSVSGIKVIQDRFIYQDRNRCRGKSIIIIHSEKAKMFRKVITNRLHLRIGKAKLLPFLFPTGTDKVKDIFNLGHRHWRKTQGCFF